MAIEDAVADEYPGQAMRFGNFAVNTSGTGKFRRGTRDDVDHFAFIDVNEGALSSPLDHMELHPGFAMAVFSVGNDQTVEGSLFIRSEDYSGQGKPSIVETPSSFRPEVDAESLDFDGVEMNPRSKNKPKKKASEKTTKKSTKKVAKKTTSKSKSKDSASFISPKDHPLLHIREPQKEYVDRVLKGMFGWNYKTSGVLDSKLMEIYVKEAKLAHSDAKKKKIVER
jgi:hypothetical protein